MKIKTFFIATVFGYVALLAIPSQHILAASDKDKLPKDSEAKTQTLQEPNNPTADLAQVVSGNNNFSFALLKQVHISGKNLVISPFSVRTAMAMMSAGAKGDTLTQLTTGMDLRLDGKRLHQAIGKLSDSLTSKAHSAYDLVVVNSLWTDKSTEFSQDFLKVVWNSYAAEAKEVDFVGKTEATRQEINVWVKGKTKNLLEELIPSGGIDSKTTMILVNAVYFKGKWQATFDPNVTFAGQFHPASRKKVPVNFMKMTAKSALAVVTPDAKLLRLPYEGDRMAMDILLPNTVSGLDALLKDLTTEKLDNMVARLSKHLVNIHLPRFSIRWGTQNILPNLKAMKMDKVFGEGADFSGVCANKLSIDAVFHQVLVEVTEEGTKAAAATAVATSRGFSTQLPRQLDFYADHPFLFFIRDVPTNAILFIGIVVNPAM